MNTIRRTLQCTDDPNTTLSFEGDGDKFWIAMEHFTVMGGGKLVSAKFTKEELVQLKKSLDLFFQ